jgi:hypothetical protein
MLSRVGRRPPPLPSLLVLIAQGELSPPERNPLRRHLRRRSPADRSRARARCAICPWRPHIRLFRCAPAGAARQRRGVQRQALPREWESFPRTPVDRVGPAIIVADHLVSDVYHRLHLRSCILPSVKTIPGSCQPRLRPLSKRWCGSIVGFDMPAPPIQARPAAERLPDGEASCTP